MLLYLTLESLSSLIPICLYVIFFPHLLSILSHITSHCIKSVHTLTQLIIKIIIYDTCTPIIPLLKIRRLSNFSKVTELWMMEPEIRFKPRSLNASDYV